MNINQEMRFKGSSLLKLKIFVKIIGVPTIVPNTYDNNFLFPYLVKDGKMIDQRNPDIVKICRFSQVMT